MALGKNNLFESPFLPFQIRNTGLHALLEFYFFFQLLLPGPNHSVIKLSGHSPLSTGVQTRCRAFHGNLAGTAGFQAAATEVSLERRLGFRGAIWFSDPFINCFLLWLLVKALVSTSSIHRWLRGEWGHQMWPLSAQGSQSPGWALGVRLSKHAHWPPRCGLSPEPSTFWQLHSYYPFELKWASQCVDPEPAPSRNSVVMQNAGLHPRPTESETWSGPRGPCWTSPADSGVR